MMVRTSLAVGSMAELKKSDDSDPKTINKTTQPTTAPSVNKVMTLASTATDMTDEKDTIDHSEDGQYAAATSIGRPVYNLSGRGDEWEAGVLSVGEVADAQEHMTGKPAAVAPKRASL